MKQPIQYAIAVICGAIALQSVYTAYFGVWEPTLHRPIILALGMIAATLSFPLFGWTQVGPPAKRILGAALDFVLIAVILLAVYQFVAISDELENGFFSIPPSAHFIALIALLAMLELTRRVFGLPLFLVGLASLGYVLFGDTLPGIFRHAGYDLGTAMEDIWYTTSGVFGLPMAILLNLVFMFIVFGAILEGTGAGASIMRFAIAATGRLRGGPAHAAIVASALFGTMSGSVIANVVGTGTLTIPMIKKRGFSPKFAGGVEAAASTGGQITPPVMGVAAFMMAEFTGVPYLYLIVAALVPAAFYYASLFLSVSLEARRLGIEPIPQAERVQLNRQDYLHSLMFIAPICAIIFVLVIGRSPVFAGFIATITAVVSAFLNPEFRAQPSKLIKAFVTAGKSCVSVLVAIATLGLVIGAMDLTGLGIRFAQLISGIAGDQLFLSLVLTMLACLILGMGMPTVPAYIIVVLVLGPAIAKLGVSTVAAHLFVFYYGVLSAITPPVALAAFSAAPIAKSNPMATAATAVRLAIIAFIIPFFFIYNPQLLIIPQATGGAFEPLVFAWALVRMGLAMWLMTTALSGYDRAALNKRDRLIRVLPAIALLSVWPQVQIAGVAIALAFVVARFFTNLKVMHSNQFD